MSGRFHVTPTGQVRKCEADKRPCKYGTERHADTREGAQEIAHKAMEAEYSAVPIKKRKPYTRRTVTDAPAMDDSQAQIMKTLVESYQRGLREKYVEVEGSYSDHWKTPKEDFQASVDRATEYCVMTGKPALLKKLADCRVEAVDDAPDWGEDHNSPLGWVSVGDLVTMKQQIDSVASQRKKIEHRLAQLADSEVPAGDYVLDDGRTKVCMRVKDGQLDNEVASTLPSEVIDSISEEKVTYSLKKAEEHLDIDDFYKVADATGVIQYIHSRKGVNVPPVEEDFAKGRSRKDDIRAGLSSMQKLYADSREMYGASQKEIKRKHANTAGRFSQKAYADRWNLSSGTLIPHATKNKEEACGLFVSKRHRLDVSRITELPPEKRALIAEKKKVISAKKAAEVLDAETFGRLFSKRVVTFTVTEKD